MTTERLAEIEARYPRPDRLYTEAQIVAMGWRALDDVPDLLAEVRRLQDATQAIAAKAWDEGYAELVAERDRLEAATEQVRALHTGSWGCSNPSHTNPEVGCPDCFIGCDACGELHPCPTIHALDGSNQ